MQRDSEVLHEYIYEGYNMQLLFQQTGTDLTRVTFRLSIATLFLIIYPPHLIRKGLARFRTDMNSLHPQIFIWHKTKAIAGILMLDFTAVGS